MDILFKSSSIKSFQNTITSYDNRNFRKAVTGENILYKYLDPALEAYTTARAMMSEEVEFNGFPGYIRMTKATYDTNDVPIGVSNSEVLDGLGDPTGVQKKWFEWNNITMERNDNIEVIIPTTYSNQAATVADLEIFDNAIDVVEVMGLMELRATYQNDISWILDELGDPLPEPPIEKTALYYIENWENESFDALHAQRLVNQWFQWLAGATITDKFNTLIGVEKKAVIQWGILPDTSEGKGLIETTILNRNNRVSLRIWHIRRLEKARRIRFSSAWAYLVDNFGNNAIVTRLEAMLTTEMKAFYILRGASNQSNHLIVNGEINPTFWATFTNADVPYGDVDLVTVKGVVEQILDGNKYASPALS